MNHPCLNKDRRPKDAKQLNSTSDLGQSLHHLILGNIPREDEELIATRIDQMIQKAVGKHKGKNISDSDLDDIGQIVLQQMIPKGILKDRRLRDLIADSASEDALEKQLGSHIKTRVHSRVIDLVRKTKREKLEPIDDLLDTEFGSEESDFPKAREIMDLLEDPKLSAQTLKADRENLLEMIRTDSSAAEVAKNLGVHRSTIQRSIKRMRPVLRKAFGLD